MNLKVWLGQYTFASLGPLNQTQVTSGEIIPDTHIFQLFRIAQTIKIEMVSRWIQGFVGLHQRIGRALYRSFVAKPPNHAPTDGGFPHTKLIIQVDNQAVAGFGNGSRQLTAKMLGFCLAFQKKPTLVPHYAHSSLASKVFSDSRKTIGSASITSVGMSPINPLASAATSAAAKCTDAPSTAAFCTSPIWPRTAPIMPESTSPMPPVAIPGLLPLITSSIPSADATTVPAPFSRIVPP